MVINIGDIKIIFCPGIGRAHLLRAQHESSGFGGFYIQPIVANEPKDLAIAINAVAAKHLFGNDFAGTGTLIVRIVQNRGYKPWFFQSLKVILVKCSVRTSFNNRTGLLSSV